jgi:hypothetical protein
VVPGGALLTRRNSGHDHLSMITRWVVCRSELCMQDSSSTEMNPRRSRRRRGPTPWVETVGGELRVWRNRGTNEIVIEPLIFAPAEKYGGPITLSARDARHLANSLLLFAAETELSPELNQVAYREVRSQPITRNTKPNERQRLR